MQRLTELETTLTPSPLMPVLFVGHGNPMNAILDNDITRNWQRVGSNLPQPQAFVAIRAHWYTDGTHITDAPRQPLIYDMYGFPEELYQVEYGAPGNPDLAEEILKVFLAYEAKLDSTWGLDHGTWSALKHLAPNATTPVLQISLNIRHSLSDIVEQFELLKPLRQKGVVFIGSGNLVHNLSQADFGGTSVDPWATEFDERATEAMSGHNIKLLTHPQKLGSSAGLAVQYDDHYRPMLASMALLEPHEELSYFNVVIEYGNLSIRSCITI